MKRLLWVSLIVIIMAEAQCGSLKSKYDDGNSGYTKSYVDNHGRDHHDHDYHGKQNYHTQSHDHFGGEEGLGQLGNFGDGHSKQPGHLSGHGNIGDSHTKHKRQIKQQKSINILPDSVITQDSNGPNQPNTAKDCIRNCPVTSEFNPVCGTNNITYGNPGRLNCAKSCGVDVSLLRRTSCNIPETSPNVPTQVGSAGPPDLLRQPNIITQPGLATSGGGEEFNNSSPSSDLIPPVNDTIDNPTTPKTEVEIPNGSSLETTTLNSEDSDLDGDILDLYI